MAPTGGCARWWPAARRASRSRPEARRTPGGPAAILGRWPRSAMSEPTATVVVGGHALAVGGRAGTLIERGAAGDGAPEVAEALGTPRVGTAARAAVDDLSDATGRAETAAGLFRAVVE